MAASYIRRGDKIVGPVDVPKLQELVAAGKMLPTDDLAKDRAGPWTKASRTKLFAKPELEPIDSWQQSATVTWTYADREAVPKEQSGRRESNLKRRVVWIVLGLAPVVAVAAWFLLHDKAKATASKPTAPESNPLPSETASTKTQQNIPDINTPQVKPVSPATATPVAAAKTVPAPATTPIIRPRFRAGIEELIKEARVLTNLPSAGATLGNVIEQRDKVQKCFAQLSDPQGEIEKRLYVVAKQFSNIGAPIIAESARLYVESMGLNDTNFMAKCRANLNQACSERKGQLSDMEKILDLVPNK